MAATTKMANRVHSSIKLAPKDTVIFSSKIIPGNDKRFSECLILLLEWELR